MLRIIRVPISREDIRRLAEESFGDLVKAVVDLGRGIMAVGGELHADEEAALLEDGSRQTDLWGINLYPSMEGAGWIEYDSMINIRPSQGNRSREVQDVETRQRISRVVNTLICD